MKFQTFSYTAGGWSSEPDGALDSEQSLVILFGASNLADRPAPVKRPMLPGIAIGTTRP